MQPPSLLFLLTSCCHREARGSAARSATPRDLPRLARCALRAFSTHARPAHTQREKEYASTLCRLRAEVEELEEQVWEEAFPTDELLDQLNDARSTLDNCAPAWLNGARFSPCQ